MVYTWSLSSETQVSSPSVDTLQLQVGLSAIWQCPPEAIVTVSRMFVKINISTDYPWGHGLCNISTKQGSTKAQSFFNDKYGIVVIKLENTGLAQKPKHGIIWVLSTSYPQKLQVLCLRDGRYMKSLAETVEISAGRRSTQVALAGFPWGWDVVPWLTSPTIGYITIHVGYMTPTLVMVAINDYQRCY